MGGQLYTIVGVMPASFQLPSGDFQLWTPLEQALGPGEGSRTLRIFRNVARLREGTTLEQAQAEVDDVAARLRREYPDTNAGVSFRYASLEEQLRGPVRRTLWLLSRGLVATRPEIQRTEVLSDTLVAVEVRWPSFDAAGAERSSERSHYILQLGKDGQLRIRVALTRTA